MNKRVRNCTFGVLFLLLSTSGALLKGQCGLYAYLGIIAPSGGTTFVTYFNYGPGYYFSFPMLAGGSYAVSTCGAPIDTQITIYNPSNGLIAYNDDNGPLCGGANASVNDLVPGFTGYANVQVSQYNCSLGGTSSINVLIRQNNNLAFTSSSAAMCSGQTRVLSATPANVGASPGGFGNPGTFSGTGVSGGVFTAPVVASPTNYTITYTFGYVSQTQVITVNPLPTVGISSSTTSVCNGNSLTLSGTGASTYAWTGGITNGVAFSPPTSTTYFVTGTSAAGCTSTNTASQLITVNPLPTVSIASPTSAICNGASITFTGSGASTYTWSSGGTANTVNVSPSSSTTFTLTGATALGCTDTETVAVTVLPRPSLTITATSNTLCYGSPVTLTGSGANTYTFTASNGAAITNGTPFTPTVTATYSLNGTSAAGCTNTSTAVSNVTVHPTLSLSGNGNNVPQGVTTSTNNNTNFGTNTTRTFSITNTGAGTLTLGTLFFTGPNASDFSVSTSPAGAVTTGTTGFAITFSPTQTGISTATVNIPSNSCGISNYSFAISASTTPANALRLNGGQFVATGNLASAITATSDITLEIWFKANSQGVILAELGAPAVGGGGTGWHDSQIEVVGATTGSVYVRVWSLTPVFAGTVSYGSWNHVAVRYDYTSGNMDGVLNGVPSATNSNGVRQAPITLHYGLGVTDGTNMGSGAYLNGELDEFRIWNKVRSTCEIQQYMNCEIPTSAANLLCNYHFNQGVPFGSNTSVNTATDSANGITATLNGFALTGSSSNWINPGAVISGSYTPATVSSSISVTGNGNNVPMGTSTSTNNNTNFGTNTSRTFSITNTGAGTLNIGSIYFTGTNANQFSVSTSPASALTSGTTGFVVAFSPTNTGISTATLNITSNDCGKPTYSFVITASTTPADALNFDGTNDVVNLAHNANYNISNSITIEAWIKTSSGAEQYITTKDNDSWYLAVNGGNSGFGKVTWWLNGVSPSWMVGGTNVNDGNWHHVVGTYDGLYMRLFVDGKLDAQAARTGTIATGTSSLQIGARSSTFYFNGSIDELRIWNIARTQCQIQQYMNCEITSTASGLVSNFHFNQGIPSSNNTLFPYNTLTDAAGTQNGNLSGFALNGSTSNWVSPGGVINGSVTPATILSAIAVSGNGNAVPQSVSTSTTNFTDFSTNTSRTFSITNSGSGTLYINTVYFTGANASQFSISTNASTAITTGTTGFVVAFTPTNTGISTATVNIVTNDCSNPTYSFVVSASTTPASALSFDGVNDMVAVPAQNLANQPFTIEFWAKRNINNASGDFIFSQGISNTTNNLLHIGFRGSPSDNNFTFGFWNNDLDYVSPTNATDGNFHHWAVVFSPTTPNKNRFIYRDGVLVASDFSSNYTGSGNAYIGSLWAQTPAFDGTIDEFRIWNTARTQCEIQQFMNCEITSTASGLVANYHFNQGVPSGTNSIAPYNTLADAAGANTGTLTNFALTGSSSNWVNPGGVVSGFTTTSAPTVTLVVSGNGNTVPMGAVTSTVNNTNFGTNATKTFSLSNAGGGTLSINQVYFTGTNANQFSLTTSPSTAVTTGTTGIGITLTPTNTGISTATVNIVTNDCANPTYSFVITASTTPADALHFDGANDYVTIPHTASLNAYPLTVESHVKTTYVGGPLTAGIVSKYITNSFNGWNLYTSLGYVSGFYFRDASNYVSYPITSTVSIADNNWHHVALVVDDLGGRIYIDGVQAGPISPWVGTPGAPTTVQNINLGLYDVNLPGSLDDIRIWNTARTQCEIQQYMKAEITSTASGLMANYHFNQGIPSGNNALAPYNTLSDAAGSNTGTLVGFGLTGSTSNWITPGSVTSGSTTPAAVNASLAVFGNGNNVPVGATTTTINNTNFGTNTTRTFSLSNAGTGTLYINHVYFTGTNASQFSLTTSASSAVTTGTTGIGITLTPTNTGISTATVNIVTNDCTNPTYSFVISASTTPASALNLDGVNDHISLSTSAPVPTGNSPYTIEAWIKPTTFNDHGIAGWGNYGTNNQVTAFRMGTGGVLINYWWANDLVVSAPTLTNGAWHHVAATFDGTLRAIYVDGVLAGSDFPSGHAVPNANNLRIGVTCTTGACSGGPEYFNGSMDEVRIWNVGRTQCDIQTYMSCEITGSVSGLVANYHFNQGIPSANNTFAPYNTLADAAGSNTGTLTNFALTGSTSNWISPGGVANGFTTTSAPTVTLAVNGNGNAVPVGVTTTTTNNTNFGTSTTKTFSLTNTGGGTLYINQIYFTGTNANQFSVTTSAATAITTGTTGFAVTLTPTNTGISTATVNIVTNDCTNPTYSFVISASTTPASALNFDGVNDRVVVPSTSSLNFGTGDMTIEAYVKTGTSYNNFTGIVTKASSASIAGYQLAISGDKLAAEFGNGVNILGIGQGLQGVTSLTNNAWHHVAMVVNRAQNNIKLYVDGKVDASVTHTLVSTINVNTAFNLLIGNERTSSYYFNGSIDEVRLWNVARTHCEIQQYMNCEITTTASGLVANYHFNQGIPSSNNALVPYNTLADAAGSNTGTLTNFALSGSTSNWINPGGVVSGSVIPATITASLAVTGNGNNVPPGVTTSTLNNTNFGTAATKSFVLTNPGGGTLYINTIFLTGTNASQFSVTTAPSSFVTTGTTGIGITLTPTNTGISTATVNIVTNDCANPTYSFVISASTTPADALHFDGSSDYVVSTQTINNASGTFEGWVKKANWADAYDDGIFSNGINFPANNSFYISLHSTVGFHFRYGGTSQTNNFYISSFATTALAANSWHHLAGTWNTTGTVTALQLYVDGVLVASGSSPISLAVNTNSVFLGLNPNGTSLLGSMDEVRIWNTVRTQCEIQQFMNCEITSTASGLVANYHFNQGVPSGTNSILPYNTLADAAGSNTGTLTNFALIGSTSNWISPGAVVNGFTTTSAPTVTLAVTGNGNPVPVGVSTSTSNNTDFGTTTAKTFSITNTGGGTLYINQIYFTGTNANQFSITTAAATSITTGTTGFAVAFSPTNTGISTATVNIVTNDCTNPTYSFVISASTTPASALDLDGVNDVVNIAHTASLNAFPLTAEAWFKTSYSGNQGAAIIGKYVSGSGNGWSIYVINNHIEAYYYRDASNFVTWPITTTLTVSDNLWHHVALTVDNSGGKIYIDGVLQSAPATWSGTIGAPTTTTNVQIGAFTTFYLPMQVDEARIWNVARTQCEIQQFMNCEITSTATGLMANYHFNQGIPSSNNSLVPYNILTDAAGVNTGTLSGFALTGSTSNWVSPGGVVSGFTTSSAPSVTLNVSSNGNSIPAGSATPTVSNNTSFGNLCVNTGTTSRTFSVSNTGTNVLYLNSISLTGSGAFTVGTYPSTLSAGGSATVPITYSTGTSSVVSTATVNILTNDCTNPTFSFAINATVNPQPTVAVTGSVLCYGQTATLNPTGALSYTLNSGTLTANGTTFAVTPTITTNYSITGSSSFGCVSSNTAVATVTINALPTVTASASSSAICNTQTITVNGSGANTYTWTASSGTATNAVAFAPGVTATYSVAGTNTTTGCTSTNVAAVTVTVNALPTVTANSSSSAICVGQTLSVFAFGANTFTWAASAGSNPLNGIPFTPTATASYSVTGTNIATGCTSTNNAVVSVTVNPLPTVALTGFSICAGTTVTLSPTGAQSYTLTSSTATVNGSTFAVTPTLTTTYSVVGTSSVGCVSSNTAVNTVTVNGANLIATGNSNTIVAGSSTPTVSNHTDFGSVFTRTFVLQNTGVATLSITSVSLSGANAGDFTITSTAPATIASASSSSITVQFIPTAAGSRSATVNINSNSCGVPNYSFVITGSAIVGQALHFSATLNNMMTSTVSVPKNVNDFTIEFWFKPTNTVTAQGLLGGYQRLELFGGKVTAGDGCQSTVAVVPNTWNHVAFVNDFANNKEYLYLNGVLTAPVYPLSGVSGQVLTLGYASSFSNYFTGEMDEVRIWKAARSQCQIQNYMNVELPASTTGLYAYYNFNQGIAGGNNSTVTSVTDLSGNNATGTLTSNFSLSGTTSNWVTGTIVPGFTTVSLPAQAIVLTGNSNNITAGDIYPSATDNSDFGTALSKTFTIQNPGTSALVVSGFSNSHPSEFNIPTTTPFTVAPSSNANFVVNYTGTLTTSIRSSTITIHNNSCANPNFVFAVNAGDRQLYVATTGDSKIAKVRNDVAYTCPSWLTIPGASTVVAISNSNGRIFYYDGTSNIGIANMNGSVINPSFVTGVSNITGMAITNNVYGGEVLYFSRGGASGGISIAETSFSTTGSVGFVSGNIRDVALYPQEQNVYYITSGSNVISMFKDYHGQNNWSANYPSFITGCNSPTGLHVDLNGGKLYWANNGNGTIGSANLDGTGVNQSFITGATGIKDLVVDNLAGKIFFTTSTGVGSVNINGTGLNTTFQTGVATSTALTWGIDIGRSVMPTLTVSSSPTVACAFGSVALTATTNATTYTWSSGANTLSTTVTPSTTTVYTLTVTDAQTCTLSATRSVSVNPVPTLNISASANTICAGSAVTFSATGANTHTWNGSLSNGVAFTPSATGIYTVTGTFTATGCFTTATQGVTVQANPTVNISSTSNTICNTFTPTLTATGAVTYTWNTGPTSSSIAVSPSVTTTYTATGTGTNSCTHSNTFVLTVNPLPTVTANASNTVICINNTIALNGGGADTYTWTSSAAGSYTNSIAFSPTTTSNYTVVGTNSLTGCTSTNVAAITVTVNPLPIVSAATSTSAACFGNSITLNGSGANTYTWIATSGTAANNVAFAPTVTATYSVTGTNSLTGCTSTNPAFVTVTVHPLPVLTISGNTVICNAGSSSLSVSGANTYTWNTASNASLIVVTPTVSTSYSVSGSDLNGCINNAAVNVSVNALPVVSLTAVNPVICFGGTTTLNASGASTYTILASSGSATQGISFSPASTATYSLVGNSAAGCTSTNNAVVGITVNPLPTLTIAGTPTICNLSSTIFTVSGANTYTWSTSAIGATVSVSPSANTSYSVNGTNTLTGCQNTTAVTLTVIALPVVNSVMTNTAFCFGGTTTLNASGANTYTWTSVSGTLANLTAITPTSAGSYTYSLAGTSTAGCTSTNSAIQTVTVHPLPVVGAAASNTFICIGTTVSLNGSGASTYTWTTASGTVSTPAAFNPTNTATYSVTGTNLTTGCTSTNVAAVTITVNPLPVVGIAGTATICNTASTTFTASGANSYLWNTAATTSVVTLNPGTTTSYTVTGTDALTSCQNTAAVTLTVHPLPNVTASASNSVICNSFTTSLVAGGAQTYTWSSPSGTLANLSVVSPTSNTSYSLVGTSTAGCTSTNTAIQTITVNPLPVVSGTASNNFICAGTGISLSASGASTYTWVSASGTLASPASFTPASTTNYSLTGTSLAGCTSTNLAVVTITVNSLPNVAIAGTASLCNTGQTTLTATGANTYTWNTLATTASITPGPNTNTTYSVTGTNTLTSCQNTAIVTVTVEPLPVVLASAINSVICNSFTTALSGSGATTYTWSSASGTLANLAVIAPSITTTYSVTGTSTAGCTSTNVAVQTITVNALPVLSGTASSNVVCAGTTISLNASGANTYTWTSLTGTLANAVTFTPASTGNYTLTGTSAAGCTGTNNPVLTVTVNALPNVVANASSTVICLNGTVSLSGSGATSYAWTNSVVNNSPFSPTSSAVYTVTGTDANTCQNTATIGVVVNALPTVSASVSNSVICFGGSVTLNGSGASTYTWSSSTSGSYTDNVAFTPSVTANYSVVGTNTLGCVSQNTAVVSVTVNALPNLSITVSKPTICFGDSSSITAAGAQTYTWSPAFANGGFVKPQTSTTYSVIATNSDNCVNTTTASVVVNALPSLTLSSTLPQSCSGQSVEITAAGASSYTWNTATSGASIVVAPTVTTVYTVTATDTNNCVNSLSYTQSVIPCSPAPLITVASTMVSCYNKNNGAIAVTASLSAYPYKIDYLWRSSANFQNASTATLTQLAAGVYSLSIVFTYTAENNFVKTDTLVQTPVTITDVNPPCDIVPFTGVTPNSDGINDWWEIPDIELYTKNKIAVFNRWGVQVAEIKGYNNQNNYWPKKSDLDKLPANTYFYIIDLGDGSKPIKGWVELIKAQ